MTKCAYVLMSNGSAVISCNNSAENDCNMCKIHTFVIPLVCVKECLDSKAIHYEQERNEYKAKYPDEAIVYPNFCYGPDDPLEVESASSDPSDLTDDPNEKVQCSFIPTRGATPGIRCTVKCKRGFSERPLCAKHKPKKSKNMNDSEYISLANL